METIKIKTKREIIEETLEYYKNNPRAINNGVCSYYTKESNMCAVGRCLENPKEFEDLINEAHANSDSSGTGIEDALNYFEEKLWDYFKPEYKINDLNFWRNLQRFHDTSYYWNDEGLTELGINYYQDLLKKYGSN